MSEENKPEDVNVNEELSSELNDQVENVETELNDAVEKVEDAVTSESEETEEVATEESSQEEGDVTEVVQETEEIIEEEKEEEEKATDTVEEGGDETESDEVTEENASEESNEETPADETEGTVENADATVTAEATETESAGPMAAAVAAASAQEETETPVEEAPKKEAPVDDGRRWYSLRVISGKERKIKERIELEIQRNKWSSAVSQVLVPSEKVYKIRSGKKVILERNILPGYILVEAYYKKFSPEIVQGIANIPNVIHFLGKTKPIPMQQSEANRMLGKVDESQEVGEALIEPFIVGETIKIIDGPFNGFVGDIKEVNDEKKKLKVIVKIFGRGTEVELNFMQVEKES